MALLLGDAFNRVSMTPGSLDTGQAWTVVSGAWDVNGTTIGETNGADGGRVLVNAGVADVLAECRFYGVGGMEAGQLVLRANSTGTTNYVVSVWINGELQVTKNVNASTLGATATGLYQEGDLVSALVTEEASLTRIRVYRNGTQVLNVTDSAAGRPSGTYVGFRHASGNTNYWTRAGSFQVRDTTDTPGADNPVPSRSFGTSWAQARDNQSVRPARIAWVGDSIFEGWGATTRSNRPAQKFLNLVRAGATGGEGYIPAYYIHNQSWKRSFVVATATITDGILYGLGKRHYSWANTAIATLTVTGTHADLMWRGGGGTFTWRVDGGSTTSVNTSGNANDAGMEGRRTRISLGTAGSHTIQIARIAGTVTFEGAIVYNGDTAAGYTLLDWSHSGFYSADHGDHGFTTLAPHMRDFQPSLVALELVGANDYLWANTTPAVNAANVQTLINRYLNLASLPDVVLVIPRITSGPNSGSRTWNEYADLIAAITHPRVKVLDLRSNSAVTLGDGVHPNDAGHAAMAQAVFDALTTTPTVNLQPAAVALGPVSVTPTPTVLLQPPTVTVTARAVTPTPQPVTVLLTPATVALTALPVTPAAGLVTVQLAPAQLQLAAPATIPIPQPVAVPLHSVTLTLQAALLQPVASGHLALQPAQVTLEARSVSPIPQSVTVALTPAALALPARPLAPAPIVQLQVAVLQLTGRPLTPTPGLVTVTLVAATMTLQAPPLLPQVAGLVQMQAAAVQLQAMPVQPVPQPVVVQLAAVQLTFTARPLGLTLQTVQLQLSAPLVTLTARPLQMQPGQLSVQLQTVVLELHAVAVTPVLGQVEPLHVLAVAREKRWKAVGVASRPGTGTGRYAAAGRSN